jgi:hypothetical protein
MSYQWVDQCSFVFLIIPSWPLTFLAFVHMQIKQNANGEKATIPTMKNMIRKMLNTIAKLPHQKMMKQSF